MKKIAVLFLIVSLGLFLGGLLKTNKIYEINVKNLKNGSVELNLKGDYKTAPKAFVENKESVYYEIKNAKLTDGFKTDYQGDYSVVAQQIGGKVRVYLKGTNLENVYAEFSANKGEYPFDFEKTAILFGILSFVSFVAFKVSSVKIVKEELKIKTPIESAMDLNRKMYDFGKRKSPEIVLHQQNPIRKTEVYDFQYAKNKKNVKIGI